MRTYSPEVIAQLEAGRISVRYLLRVNFDDGPQGIWTGDYAIVHDEVTFLPIHGNMIVDALPGNSDLSADSMQVTLSHLNPDVAGLLENHDWHQRPVVIYRAFLAENGTVLDVFTEFAGFLDEAPVSDSADEMAAIVAAMESGNRELNRQSGRMRADNDQRTHGGATDGFFKYATAAATDIDIYWGRKGPTSPVR